MIGVREFFRRWKKGMENIPPIDQLKAKRVGIAGQVVGMLVATSFLLFQGMWAWVPVTLFTVMIFCVEFVGVHQQVKQLEEFDSR